MCLNLTRFMPFSLYHRGYLTWTMSHSLCHILSRNLNHDDLGLFANIMNYVLKIFAIDLKKSIQTSKTHRTRVHVLTKSPY